jgi:hypothetical protein
VAKIIVYAGTVFYVQNGITYDEYSDITDRSHVMAWLHYEIIAFYVNILSVVAFLAVASFRPFRTFRERLGLAGQARKTLDFLTYCKDDLHWFQLWFCQLSFFVCGIIFRANRDVVYGLTSA